jgi:hypothetical protein
MELVSLSDTKNIMSELKKDSTESCIAYEYVNKMGLGTAPAFLQPLRA